MTNQRKIGIWKMVAVVAQSFIWTPLQAGFVHPGIAHNADQIAFAKAKLSAGEEPWATAWENLRNSRSAELDWAGCRGHGKTLLPSGH